MKRFLVNLLIFGTLLVSCGLKQNSIDSEFSSSISENDSQDNSSLSSTSIELKDSSDVSSVNIELQTFTVIWKNENGDILETDKNVEYGSTPTYDGKNPKKENNDDRIYVFCGWSPSISEVVEDVVYTATYKEISNEGLDEGLNPVISSDGKRIKYGFYPQTYIENKDTISALDVLEPSTNGWVLYEGEFYAKIQAKVYNDELIKFNNGSPIINGSSYWFKCEPINWNILSIDGNDYFLLSSLLIDVYKYYDNYLNRTIGDNLIYSNNYCESKIRHFLNADFYNIAFCMNSEYIKEINVDNSSITTDSLNSKYTCNNTLDKVYLPSYSDYLNSSYGFEKENGLSLNRTCKTTDYTRARGAWINNTKEYLNNGTYWTRSASSKYYYCSWNVNSGGYLSEYAIDGNNHCVRPCITITL